MAGYGTVELGHADPGVDRRTRQDCARPTVEQDTTEGGTAVSALPTLKVAQAALKRGTTVSVPEAARLLGISRDACYEMAKSGELPAIRIGPRRIRIPARPLADLLENGDRR
ncbi:excisionase family DNA-binding protein [Gordonia sp. LSe1-13]|uniref:Excisionase family DNA-binding protein n=1 Tax=Gordonia sesuvii TaxID=3116777 RepID=A0ABU7MJB6_9ACTN|nr:excisionase family DNA-binding protein [Gordonia sp. LSe1-13]